MSFMYKDFDLNDDETPKPWAPRETLALVDIINTLVGDTLTGLKEAGGHKHNKLYSSVGVAGVEIGAAGDTKILNLTVAGVVTNLATGALETVQQIPIGYGGTNSGTALNNDRVIVSSGGAIVESVQITVAELGLLDGMTSVVLGTANNDKLVSQGYVDDAVGGGWWTRDSGNGYIHPTNVNDILGIGTVEPFQNIGTTSGDIDANKLGAHIKSVNDQSSILVIEGWQIPGGSGDEEAAAIILADNDGDADDKMIAFQVGGGIAKFSSLLDDQATEDYLQKNVDDILVIDLGTGHIGIKAPPGDWHSKVQNVIQFDSTVTDCDAAIYQMFNEFGMVNNIIYDATDDQWEWLTTGPFAHKISILASGINLQAYQSTHSAGDVVAWSESNYFTVDTGSSIGTVVNFFQKDYDFSVHADGIINAFHVDGATGNWGWRNIPNADWQTTGTTYHVIQFPDYVSGEDIYTAAQYHVNTEYGFVQNAYYSETDSRWNSTIDGGGGKSVLRHRSLANSWQWEVALAPTNAGDEVDWDSIANRIYFSTLKGQGIVFNFNQLDFNFIIASIADFNSFVVDGASGNIGIRTVPNSDWISNFRVIEFEKSGGAYGGALYEAGSQFGLVSNAFYSQADSRWNYKTTGNYALRFEEKASSVNFAAIMGGTAGDEVPWVNANTFIVDAALGTIANFTSKDHNFTVRALGISKAFYVDGAKGNIGIHYEPGDWHSDWVSLSIGDPGANPFKSSLYQSKIGMECGLVNYAGIYDATDDRWEATVDGTVPGKMILGAQSWGWYISEATVDTGDPIVWEEVIRCQQGLFLNYANGATHERLSNDTSGMNLSLTHVRHVGGLFSGAELAGVANDDIFTIYGTSRNDAGTPEVIHYGEFTCKINSPTDGAESGSYAISLFDDGASEEQMRLEKSDMYLFNDRDDATGYEIFIRKSRDGGDISTGNDDIGAIIWEGRQSSSWVEFAKILVADAPASSSVMIISLDSVDILSMSSSTINILQETHFGAGEEIHIDGGTGDIFCQRDAIKVGEDEHNSSDMFLRCDGTTGKIYGEAPQ